MTREDIPDVINEIVEEIQSLLPRKDWTNKSTEALIRRACSKVLRKFASAEYDD